MNNLNHKNENNIKNIGKIIERMGNNHFKWYITHIMSLAFFITTYSFLFNFFNNKPIIIKLFIYIIVGISFNFISFIIFYNSWKYLKIERGFRTIQANAKNKNIKLPYKLPNYYDYINKKYGFVFWTEIILSFLILISSIIFPFFSEI